MWVLEYLDEVVGEVVHESRLGRVAAEESGTHVRVLAQAPESKQGQDLHLLVVVWDAGPKTRRTVLALSLHPSQSDLYDVEEIVQRALVLNERRPRRRQLQEKKSQLSMEMSRNLHLFGKGPPWSR